MGSKTMPQVETAEEIAETTKQRRNLWLAAISLVFSLLQSLCTVFIALSGLRFVVGFASLASSLVSWSPALAFHQNAIRVPMLILAVLGATLNLFAVWRVRRLRNRPASQWRRRPVTEATRRKENWQLAMSWLTLLLVVAEMAGHKHLHGVYLF